MHNTCLHILDNSFNPDPRVLKEIRTIQTTLGLKVILACIYKESPEIKEEYNIDVRRIIPYNVKTFYKSNISKTIDSLSDIIKSENILIIHAHDHISLNIAAKLKRKHPELKLIYDAHEYIKGWYYYQQEKKPFIRFKGLLVQRIYAFFERKNLKHVDVLITVSIGLKDLFKKAFLNRPIYVLRNVSYKSQYNINPHLREVFDFEKKDVIVLHSGGIYYEEKSLKYIFENIMISNNQFKFVFLCNQKEKSKVINSPFYNQIKEKVFFHDLVPYDTLSNFISSANIGLILNHKPHWPSHWHSLPNRIFDYSNAGLAIVATKQPEFVRFINNNKNGLFFDFNKPNDLNRALEEISINLEQYKENSKEASSENVWEQEEKILISIYKNLNL